LKIREEEMPNSKKETNTCQICHKEKKRDQLRPAITVRHSLVDLITKDGHQWDENGFICVDDLNNYRARFVQNMLQEEGGELSVFDKEVLESIVKRDILSENVDEKIEQKLSFGQRLSDKIAKFGGSWRFIIIFFIVLIIWMAINTIFLLSKAFDPYPFILLNLILSCLAAIQAPIIMMSQNRQEEKDRARSLHDYQVNLKAEVEIRMLHDKIDYLTLQQGQKMLEIQQIQIELMEEISNRIKK
jgi:uncharacterized membrane protein